MAELKHFLFNSDYPTDKIAFAQTGTHVYASPPDLKYVFINTHVKTILYAEGDYKIRGSDRSYSMSDAYNSDARVISFMHNGECWLALELIYYEEDYGKVMDYRVWAYYNEEDAKNTDISLTANVSKRKLIFDSDEDYPRFVADGYIESGAGYNYEHDLGHIPFIKVWSLYTNETIPNPNGGGTITVQCYKQNPIAFFGDADHSVYSANIIHVTYNKIWTHPVKYPGDAVGTYFRIYEL